MYQTRTIKEIVSLSIELRNYERKLKNIKLIKALARNLLSGFDNLLYIKLTLMEIELTKKLFVFEVEMGDTTVIPNKLSHSNFGQSFSFYDPILSIIQDQCSDHKRLIFMLRNQHLLHMAVEENRLWDKIKKKFMTKS